jgi:hypothetical protein
MDPDADPDPAIFVIGLQDTNKKIIKKRFRIQEAQKHVDLVDSDSDPEHCLKEL